MYPGRLKAGCSLGIGDWKILWLLRRILRLNFTRSLKDRCSFIIIHLLLYTILLFLIKCLLKTIYFLFAHRLVLTEILYFCMHYLMTMLTFSGSFEHTLQQKSPGKTIIVNRSSNTCILQNFIIFCFML